MQQLEREEIIKYERISHSSNIKSLKEYIVQMLSSIDTKISLEKPRISLDHWKWDVYML